MNNNKIQWHNGRLLFDGKKVQDLEMDEKHEVDDYFREYKDTIEVYKLLDQNRLILNNIQ